MKKLQSLFTNLRKRLLVADCICALATASVNTRQPCSTRALEREEIEPLRKQWTSRGRARGLWGSPVFAGLLLLLTTMCSCAHTRYIPLPEHHSRDSLSTVVHKKVNNTYVDRTHTLVQRGDTIFKTDSIYVEKFTDVEVHDTVTVTIRDSIPYPVEVPVEVPAPIPRFYKNCTIGFFLLLLAILAYIAIRFYLHR